MKCCSNCIYGALGARKEPCGSCIHANKHLDNPFSQWKREQSAQVGHSRELKSLQIKFENVETLKCSVI